MKPSANNKPSENRTPPQYWSMAISGEGGNILTYAVRSGGGYLFLLALGAICLLGGMWAMVWLTSESELTVAGIIFLLLVPGGAMLFGIYCLNIALWLRSEYLLGQFAFVARHFSLFGDKRLEIPRQAIEAISQSYSPPNQSAPTGAPGTWATFVVYRNAGKGKLDDYALDGQDSKEEALWLGQILSKWANVPLKRGFGTEFEEADPNELPEL